MAVDGTSGEVGENTEPKESGDIEVKPLPEEDAIRRAESSRHPEWDSGEEELSIKAARGGTRLSTDKQ